MANLHNNQAGRVAVRKTMKQLCKCHGVSGSCATQTCWRQVSEFKEVGKFLKKQYKRALRVDYDDDNSDQLDNLMSNRIERRVPRNQRDKRRSARAETLTGSQQKVKKRKLVFLQSSPDYCRMNVTAGYKGVIGRTCESDPKSPDPRGTIRKCTKLCRQCGLYVRKKVVDVVTSCNCKFEWCCKVSCQSCHKKQVKITCTNTPDFYRDRYRTDYSTYDISAS